MQDPNEGRNDPMVPEHWKLGEDLQDAIRHAGYESDTVEGIAVDLHDLLQAADRIREEIAPTILSTPRDEMRQRLSELAFELDHIRWHCEAGLRHLNAASEAISAQ